MNTIQKKTVKIFLFFCAAAVVGGIFGIYVPDSLNVRIAAFGVVIISAVILGYNYYRQKDFCPSKSNVLGFSGQIGFFVFTGIYKQDTWMSALCIFFFLLLLVMYTWVMYENLKENN